MVIHPSCISCDWRFLFLLFPIYPNLYLIASTTLHQFTLDPNNESHMISNAFSFAITPIWLFIAFPLSLFIYGKYRPVPIQPFQRAFPLPSFNRYYLYFVLKCSIIPYLSVYPFIPSYYNQWPNIDRTIVICILLYLLCGMWFSFFFFLLHYNTYWYLKQCSPLAFPVTYY